MAAVSIQRLFLKSDPTFQILCFLNHQQEPTSTPTIYSVCKYILKEVNENRNEPGYQGGGFDVREACWACVCLFYPP